MTTGLEKSCSFGLLCVFYVNVCVCHSFPFDIEVGMRYVIILIPGHCLSIYFSISL